MLAIRKAMNPEKKEGLDNEAERDAIEAVKAILNSDEYSFQSGSERILKQNGQRLAASFLALQEWSLVDRSALSSLGFVTSFAVTDESSSSSSLMVEQAQFLAQFIDPNAAIDLATDFFSVGVVVTDGQASAILTSANPSQEKARVMLAQSTVLTQRVQNFLQQFVQVQEEELEYSARQQYLNVYVSDGQWKLTFRGRLDALLHSIRNPQRKLEKHVLLSHALEGTSSSATPEARATQATALIAVIGLVVRKEERLKLAERIRSVMDCGNQKLLTNTSVWDLVASARNQVS